jgi:uncharacterized protein (DUF169 family)
LTVHAESSSKIKNILGLSYSPVGVKFVKPDEELPSDADILSKKSRYCQLLMRARKGETLTLLPENLACPAAYAAFGFGQLPEKISSGEMLFALGLYADKDAAVGTMRTMPRLQLESVSAVTAGPLDRIRFKPDVIVVESLPEQVMWLCLARTYRRGGRLNFSSSIFQCCCVDVTVVPYVTKEVNVSLGCYGTREATDVPHEDMFMGIHSMLLDEVVEGLEGLSKKAMIRAREKRVYKSYSTSG